MREERNRQQDIEILCDCTPEFIATDVNDIVESTQVFCNDTGSKISFVDFREEKNKQKLPQIIAFVQTFKETGSPARLDVAIGGGIVPLEINPKTLELLRTYESAVAAYKAADGGSSSWVWDGLKKIPWGQPEFNYLDVHIMNYGGTNSRQREQMVADMDKAGYRPLTFVELVALGIVRPDLNKRDEIINTYEIPQLGGGPLVPFLLWRGGGRGLSAGRAGGGWDEHNRFLFVRK